MRDEERGAGDASGARSGVAGRGFAQPAQRSDELEDADLVLGIEAGSRLVDQENRRFLRERPRDEHALSLAAGELRHRAVGEIGRVALEERAARGVEVGGGRRGEALDVRVTAGEDEILDADFGERAAGRPRRGARDRARGGSLEACLRVGLRRSWAGGCRRAP